MARPPHRVLSLFSPPQPSADEGDGAREPPDGPRPKTVSQLVNEVRYRIEKAYLRVFVEGELFEVRRWSGPGGDRVFFKLKDQNNFLECVIAGDALARLRFDIDDGLVVQARGQLSVYRSRVQLNVRHLEPAGQGALALAFDQLKEKLAREGLFDDERKRPLPMLPRCVGLVTSKQGAAVRDMLKVLRQRMPGVSIVLSPTRVGGAESAPDILRALSRLDESRRCDVILLGRGGGSLEDLWAFNDPALVRAVVRSHTPIIAAVGHETDVTLTCLAADVRAATPSHAAERAVPVKAELVRRLARDERHLEQRLRACLDGAHLRLRRAEKKLGDPHALLRPVEKRLAFTAAHLEEALQRRLRKDRARLDTLTERLARRSPERTLQERRRRSEQLKERLLHASPAALVTAQKRRAEQARARLLSAAERQRSVAGRLLGERAAQLHALSPLAVLDRGFALVRRDDDGLALVRAASSLEAGDEVRVRFADGEVRARVTERVDTTNDTDE